MLKLKKLQFSGVRSFLAPTQIEFPQAGLFLIRGKNLDTGGSSGSGKSSILHVIQYGVDGCPISAKGLQCWDSSDHFEIEYTFDADGKQVKLQKGKVQSIQVEGEKKATGADAVADKLKKLTGYDDFKVLRALSYREQKKQGFFLKQTDGERKEFLTRVLGLNKVEDEIDNTNKTVGIIENSLFANQEYYEKIKADLDADTGYAYGEIDPTPHEKKIEALSVELQDREAAGKRLKAEYEGAKANPPQPDTTILDKELAALTQVKAFLARTKEVENGKRLAIENIRNQIQEEIRGVLVRLEAIKIAKNDIVKLEKESDKLQASLCPYCGQKYVEAKKKYEENALKIARLCLIGADEPVMKAKNNELLQLLDTEKYVQAPLLETLQEATIKQGQIVATEQARLAAAAREGLSELANQLALERVEYGRVQDQLSAANAELQGVLRANTQELKFLNESIARRNQLEEKVVAAKQKVDADAVKVNELKDWLGCLKGYLGGIFDEILDEISHETNRILSKLANISHCRLTFVSEVETLKGKVNKKIVPIVSIGGHEAPYESGCSGGMITSLELAVDLALGKVIERRTGQAPGWLILDEVFEGYDLVTRETCLEILREYAQDRLVIIVDHASETKESFTNIIEVQFKGGFSTISSSKG